VVPTLLVFSLLLHIVTFYIIIVLFQRMNHLKSQPNVDTFTDLDGMLEAHLEAVRAENQTLIDSIDKSRVVYPKPQQQKVETIVTTDKIEPKSVESPKIETKPVAKKQKQEAPMVKVEEPVYTPPVENIVDQVERSSTAEVLHLHEKGYSSQEIAKKLNIGKGEVELMLNLSRKRLK
jgi:ATP/maltotriose-dependent transcriptional regulator MalT